MSVTGERELPVLVVGDVHGDLERLFQALKPYPAAEWRTIFLGDLVDYGPFGVGALRAPTRIGFWISIGGQQHDLDELAKDAPLQRWMRERPALLQLSDRTLAQHCGSDSYAALLESGDATPIAAVNARVRELLAQQG